jgi:hypothetical protein
MEQTKPLQEGPKQELITRIHYAKKHFQDRAQYVTKNNPEWHVIKTWFVQVAAVLADIIRYQYTDNPLVSNEFYNEVHAYYRKLVDNNNPIKHRPPQKEDADEPIAMLDKILAELEK